MFNLSKSGTRFLIVSLVVFVVGASLMAFVGGRFLIRGQQYQLAGAEYGKGKVQQGCLDEALRRHVPTIDPTMQVAQAGFVGGCLVVSKRSEGFCDDVPAFDMLNQGPIVRWSEEKCEQYGFTDNGCAQIFMQTVVHCKMSKYDDRK